VLQQEVDPARLAEEPELPLVIHGVHRTFHPPTLLARWPDDGRRSQLVFITRDLDRATVATSWDEMA